MSAQTAPSPFLAKASEVSESIQTRFWDNAKWKEKPADDLITEASLARELWLLVDHSTPAGKEFWKTSDKARAK